MGLFQRDILMRQIEALSAWLARQLNQAADVVSAVEEAECEQAAGLSLDIAASLPVDGVIDLVDDGPRLVVLALGLARRAAVRQDPNLATRAHALWSAGVHRAPELHDPEVEARLLELLRS